MSKAVTELLRALAVRLGGLFAGGVTRQRNLSREFHRLGM